MARSRKARTVGDWFTHHRKTEPPASSVRYRHRSSNKPRTARPQRELTPTDKAEESPHDHEEMGASSGGDTSQPVFGHQQPLGRSFQQPPFEDDQLSRPLSPGDTSTQSPREEVSHQQTLIDPAFEASSSRDNISMQSTSEGVSQQQGPGHSASDPSLAAHQLAQQQGSSRPEVNAPLTARQLAQRQTLGHSDSNLSSSTRASVTAPSNQGGPNSSARKVSSSSGATAKFSTT
jgi:hypothetical protein